MLERLNDIESAVSEHMNECNGKKVIKAYTDKIKELDKKVNNMSGEVTIERWEITKLIVVSLIVPILNGFGFILSEWLNLGTWSWVPLVIVVNSISIPTIVAWLTKKFDKKELAMEVKVSALKDKHAAEILVMKDEVFTERINAGLAKAELGIAQDKIKVLETALINES